jgi:ATP-dependent DNA helicase RecQ
MKWLFPLREYQYNFPMNEIESLLNERFQFNSFRKGQREVIEKIMTHRSVAAIFPTGAGKSLCYQLPALMLPHLTLVVSPLLSLMKDQLDFLLSHNIPAAKLDSSLSREEYNRIIHDAVEGKLKILMISVERFKNERFRNQLQKIPISLLAIDEAHCISEWGHNFRPEYLRLPDYRNFYGINQVLLLTATATEKVASDMCSKFHIAQEDLISTGFYRPNLFLKVSPLKEQEKKEKLLSDLTQSPRESTIIYVTLQKKAEEIAAYLTEKGIKTAAYHGGMKNEDRIRIQNLFMRGDQPHIVATIAFGMGIDKKEIRRVIHYDLPKSIENYSQEIGRAGRDGLPSVCEVYGCKSNLPVLENFIYGDTPDKEAISLLLQEIKKAGRNWEIKSLSLSKETNIRALPLKTLLVYLSMKKIISPQYTYFEDYSFKYNSDALSIINRFEGERKDFVTRLLENCHTKKTWTKVDMNNLTEELGLNRQRILAALDYFDGQNWIDLTSSQAVEVYDVINESFDSVSLGDELFTLFKEKEESEIERIHNMIQFFEGDSCYSRKLASYFGENLTENCGHCSHCEGGRITMKEDSPTKPLEGWNKRELCEKAESLLLDRADSRNLAKFLGGLTSPLFTRLKLNKLPSFGILAEYPVRQIEKWLIT